MPGVLFHARAGASNACQATMLRLSTNGFVFCRTGALAHRDREAFQEVDYRAFFVLVKWVAEVERRRLPRIYRPRVSGG
jgi:acetolactate synthase-1/2/3 large subunit